MSQEQRPVVEKGFSFPKSRRLLRRKDFLRVQQKGRRVHLGPLIACVMPRKSGEPLRLGITTSRKVGKAVFRNRMRRLVREAIRHFLLHDELPFDVVFIARKGIDPAIRQEEINRQMARFLRKLLAWKSRPHPTQKTTPPS